MRAPSSRAVSNTFFGDFTAKTFSTGSTTRQIHALRRLCLNSRSLTYGASETAVIRRLEPFAAVVPQSSTQGRATEK